MTLDLGLLAGSPLVGGQRFSREGQLNESQEMVVKVLASDIASHFIDPFDDKPDIDQAPEGDFFTDLKKVAHNRNFKSEWN